MSSTKLPLEQLIVLAVCRFAEPFALASLFPYVPSYLRHLGVEETQVATWTGILAAVFGVCESTCAIPLTKLSDKLGRKQVLLASLGLQCLGNLALGFCSQVWHAVVCLLLVGAGNGNVAIMRTLVAELVAKEQQAKAFAFLPTSAGIGTILGPAVGGLSSTVVISQSFPFALPNVISAALFMPGIAACLLRLHVAGPQRSGYQQVAAEDEELQQLDASPIDEDQKVMQSSKTSRPGRLWVALNCFIWLNALSGLHAVGFDHMLPVFLQLPVQSPSDRHHALQFASGLGRGPRFTGILLTVAGICGILTAALAYPSLAKKSSHLQILRLSTICFPGVYLLFPFTGLLAPSLIGILVCLLLILAKVSLSVMALQSSMILLTNSVAADTVSTVHGVNFTIAGLCRGFGSLSSGLLFAYGLRTGYLIVPFWVMACWASSTILIAFGLARES